MSQKASNQANSLPQIVIASVIIIIAFGGYFSTAGQFSEIARLLGLIAFSMISLVVLALSPVGRRALAYVGGARTEVRKMVWPTRQEATQMTLIVFVAVFLVGVFLWAVDSFFLWFIELIV